MKYIFFSFIIVSIFAFGATVFAQTQQKVQLPSSAHNIGETAGFYIDPITGNRIYRLSDRVLCPNYATHVYSYTNVFSAQGRMVFSCGTDATNPNIGALMMYDNNFTLISKNVVKDAKFVDQFGNARTFGDPQWSQTQEILYGISGTAIIKLDPSNATNSVYANFRNINGGSIIHPQTGVAWPITAIDQISVGPHDRVSAQLKCVSCPDGSSWTRFAVGIYDPLTGNYTYRWVLNDPLGGFDESQLTQNPSGRIYLAFAGKGTVCDLNFSNCSRGDGAHYGFVSLSNGRHTYFHYTQDCVGSPYWQTEFGLYDDVTGQVLVRVGCNTPGQHDWDHKSRSIGAKDILSITTNRFTFAPSGTWQPTYESILKLTTNYSGGQPSSMAVKPLGYHRSAYGPWSTSKGKDCGYWASPRGAIDHTGNRVLFDSTASHPDWPSLETNGSLKTDCKTDVYVVVDGGGMVPPPPSGSSCINPSSIPVGFASPCPVLSISAQSVSRSSGSLTINTTPSSGSSAYIYTTVYISNNGQWIPYTLSGSSSYPGWSTSQASLNLNSSQLSSLTTGTHYIVSWDWTWNGSCFIGPGSTTCNQGAWRIQQVNLQ